MRNLKRALSLTLASVMLLGMMVVGSSAAAGYSDVDENDNVEAIEVLQAVEVMVGDDRGFGPDRPVTRNEMAVVMGKLLNLNYNYYVSTCPFTDVADWAKGWVGACYANGIVSGRGNGIYDGEATVTAVEAASMMMRALGYFKYTEDYADGFNVVTVRQGSEIGIFNDVGTDAATPMTRNQVAQMALNALKANMVTFTGTPGIEVNGVKVGYKAEYTARTSPDRKYAAIGKLVSNIGTTDQYYIQLGEELYDGDLRLNDDSTDDFGRPARYWEYDGTAIGTYAKKELLDESYTEKVTGKTLYDLLGKDLVNLIDGSDRDTRYTLTVTIDGNDDNATQTKVFGKSALSRTNTDAVGGTGNGVLTEVYVDNTARTIDIAIINTYLAIADNDYNEKKDEVSLNIYNLDKSGSLYFKDYKRDGDGDSWRDAENVLKANGEDFAIKDVKKDDKFLVTVAKGEIKSVVAPEILTEQTITSHKTNDYVVSDKQYDYATTAQYDVDVMESFGSDDMKEVTYNVVLDKYGYLIGVEKNEAVNQYVFLTGVDDEFSHLSQKNVPANVIFLDGSMKTVTINAKKSVLTYDPDGDASTDNSVKLANKTVVGTTTDRRPSQANMWCTYSVDSDGVYTLKAVAGVTSTTNKVKVAQSAQNAGTDIKINSKNISLDGSAPFTKVHGNADTVYINTTALEPVEVSTGAFMQIIDDVDSVTTGVTNVDMTVKNIAAVSANNHTYHQPVEEVYTLYNDKGVILAVVTLNAEDNATTARYAYITGKDIDHRDYDGTAKEYSWYRQAIVDGEFVMLKEVDDSSSSTYLAAMERGKWYEIKYNADDEVRGYLTVKYPLDSDADVNAPSGVDAPDGTKTPTTTEVGTHYMQDANYVARELDKTFILNADLTAIKPELKTLGNTLYIGNSTTEGFYVSPTAKVVVYTKNYDKHEEYTGAEMEKALNALVNKKAFDGIVNAVIGSDGVATVVILDEKNMDAPDTYSVSFTGDEHVNITNVTSLSGLAKGANAQFKVSAKNGYVLDSVKVSGVDVPVADGVYTIYNITENVSVTIATSRDTNAYAGEVVFNTTTNTAVKVEWTGEDEPTNDELFALLVEELVKLGYDRSTMTDKSASDGTTVAIEASKTIGGVPAGKKTFTITKLSDMTEVAEAASQAELDAALAGSADKIKLSANATVTAAPGADIVVASGSTLTINAATAIDLGKDITGEGNVTVGGAGGVTTGEKIKVSGKTTVNGTIDNLTAVQGDVDVMETVTVADGMTLAANKTLTIADGKTLTLTTGSTLNGSVTAGAGTNGATLVLSGASSVKNVDNKVSINAGNTLSVTGTAAPKALIQSANKITVAATGKLTLPAAFTTTAGGIDVAGELVLSANLEVAATKAIDVKATGTIDFNGKNLTGAAATADFIIASGATVKNFTAASQNFYDNSNAKLTTNNAIAADTYSWSTTADGASAPGWVDDNA